jgi:hypothetical protein
MIALLNTLIALFVFLVGGFRFSELNERELAEPLSKTVPRSLRLSCGLKILY